MEKLKHFAQLSKAVRIHILHGEGKSVREIAFEVYGLTPQSPVRQRNSAKAYVRVVLRQRRDGESAGDRKWRTSAHGREVYNAKVRRWARRCRR